MNLNGNPHHMQPEKQNTMYHFSNHPMYHQNVYPQTCPMYLGHTKHSIITGPAHDIHAPIHNSQDNVHSMQATVHNSQVTAHIPHVTLQNIQTTVHNTHPIVHDMQCSAHNTQPNTHNSEVIVHNSQSIIHTNETHKIETSIHNSPSSTLHTNLGTAHNSPTAANNTQGNAPNISTAHNTQITLTNNTQQTTHNNKLEVIQQNKAAVEPKNADTENSHSLVKVEVIPEPEKILSKTDKKQKAAGKSKNSVDTSHFSIEERLIAAVWVHERKNIKKSMRQLKHDFLQRFGRKAPAKNTLLGWERKLFSTGCLEDAPRTGRPVKRRSRVEEVAASIRAAPTLSLRARALALRVPTTTLHTILRRDLSVSQQMSPNSKQQGQTAHHTGKTPTKKNPKKPKPGKKKLESPLEDTISYTPQDRDFPPPANRDVFADSLALSLS